MYIKGKADVNVKLIKDLRKGQLFTFKDYPEPKDHQVWIRDEYDKVSKKYLVICWNCFNKQRLVKGDKIVFTDFTF